MVRMVLVSWSVNFIQAIARDVIDRQHGSDCACVLRYSRAQVNSDVIVILFQMRSYSVFLLHYSLCL
jgi:hypothetical protein